MTNKNNVFVYGTLKSGHGANYMMTERGGVKLSDAKVYGMRLFDLGGFPCVMKSDDATQSVIGEVYQVDDVTLKKLDGYEGVSTGLFSRELVTCVFNDNLHNFGGTELGCYIYHWGDDTPPNGAKELSGMNAEWRGRHAKDQQPLR